ncbi:MAG TPA: tetratricopeptide repeat protein [Blastocatellia bacterium]|nr:tetratricopeptide repeat protein [Blastocatellia bacterium]
MTAVVTPAISSGTLTNMDFIETARKPCRGGPLWPPLAATLLLALGTGNLFASTLPLSAQAKKTPAPRKQPPKPKASPPDSPAQLTPREAFDRARLATTANARIDLLEKFVAAGRDSRLEAEARELLMREYALRGEQHLREANPKLALRDFKAVFRTAPLDIGEKVFTQYIFPLPMAMNAFGYRIESVELMKSFEPRFEGDANRLVQIGFFYVQIEAPIEAARVLERAVQLAPEDHRAHNSLGNAYLIGLRLDDAAAEFQRALELNPRDEFANLSLANLARATGNHEGAVTYYRKQLALKPDDAEALGGMAISLLALGRDEEAAPAISRASTLAPENYRFPVQLAYFYVTRKKASLARPLVDRALKIEPRYAWTSITKANVDALEGKQGDGLATLITAQQLGGFPTLTFELAKALITVDGYDQTIEVMNRAFKITPDGEFETMLGGVTRGRSPRLDLLLERERQVALFLNEHPTTSLQYRLIETVCRIDHFTKIAVAASKGAGTGRRGARPGARAGGPPPEEQSRPRRAGSAEPLTAELSAGPDANLPGVQDLLAAITTFTTLDDGRQPFRMVWAARKLTESGVAVTAAEQLARRAIAVADAATEPDGSMRDAPLLDREGRRLVFLGRAYDALGWALFKRGNTRGAVDSLAKAVEYYPSSAERRNALWHFAIATEEAGDERRALDLYIASYETGTATSAAKRTHIESLYKKLNGSLAGLDDKLRGSGK